MFSNSKIPKEDCPPNDEYILSICTFFLLLDISDKVFVPILQSVNSSEYVEPNVWLFLEFLR